MYRKETLPQDVCCKILLAWMRKHCTEPQMQILHDDLLQHQISIQSSYLTSCSWFSHHVWESYQFELLPEVYILFVQDVRTGILWYKDVSRKWLDPHSGTNTDWSATATKYETSCIILYNGKYSNIRPLSASTNTSFCDLTRKHPTITWTP